MYPSMYFLKGPNEIIIFFKCLDVSWLFVNCCSVISLMWRMCYAKLWRSDFVKILHFLWIWKANWLKFLAELLNNLFSNQYSQIIIDIISHLLANNYVYKLGCQHVMNNIHFVTFSAVYLDCYKFSMIKRMSFHRWIKILT